MSLPVVRLLLELVWRFVYHSITWRIAPASTANTEVGRVFGIRTDKRACCDGCPVSSKPTSRYKSRRGSQIDSVSRPSSLMHFTTGHSYGTSTATSICFRAALFVDARPEFETLYLSGRCFRKLGKEFYPMRALEDRQTDEHKFLQFPGEFRRARYTIARHNAGDRFGQFVFVLAEDHRRFLHGRMLD